MYVGHGHGLVCVGRGHELVCVGHGHSLVCVGHAFAELVSKVGSCLEAHGCSVLPRFCVHTGDF